MMFTGCQHCRSKEYRRVDARNAFEQAFSWILLPYRCSLCGHHLMLFRWLNPSAETL
jgi:hypothetical protein